MKKKSISSTTKIDYERKIATSSFSINTSAILGFSKSIDTKGYSIQAGVEPRFYYSLKKNIAKGKSANNLSGAYFSFLFNGAFGNGEYLNAWNSKDSTFQTLKWKTNGFTIIPKWGIQKRLFKNGFVDFSVNFMRFDYSKRELTYLQNNTIRDKASEIKFKVDFSDFAPIDFKIGFAF
jgi:hypothetical protein